MRFKYAFFNLLHKYNYRVAPEVGNYILSLNILFVIIVWIFKASGSHFGNLFMLQRAGGENEPFFELTIFFISL